LCAIFHEKGLFARTLIFLGTWLYRAVTDGRFNATRSGEIGRERDGEWVWRGRGGGGVRALKREEGKEKYVMYTCCICVEPTTKKFLGGEY